MRFDKKRFVQFAVENNFVGFYEQPRELSSGEESHFYIDWRKAKNKTPHLVFLAHEIINFSLENGLNPSAFVGVPDGATVLGAITQFEFGMKHYGKTTYSSETYMGIPQIRAQPKRVGTQTERYFVGELPPNGTVLIEDVPTTGRALRDAISKCLDAGIKEIKAVSLTDRSGGKVQSSLDVPFYALATARDLIVPAYERLQPGEKIGRAVENEFREKGLGEIRLIR